MKGQLKQNLDLLVSGLILVSALCTSVYSYASILSLEAPSHVFFSNMSLGERSFVITHKEKCVGNVQTLLSHETTYQFSSHGNLSSSLGKKVIPAEFKVQADFNPLGQMTSADISLTSNASTLVIQAANVNPVEITFTAGMGERKSTHNFSVPGPIYIKRTAAGYFQFEYEHMSAGENSPLKAVSGFAPNLEVDIKQTDNPQLACPPEAISSLELSPLVAQMQALVAPILEFAPAVQGMTK